MNEAKGWKWATLILAAVLLMLLSFCSGAWLGGMVGFRFGTRVTDVSHQGIPMPDYPYSEPVWPERPEIPERPEVLPDDERPWLGLAFRMVEEGALVALIVPDSPAEDVGLRVGDIISEVDGRNVTEAHPLDEHILRYAPGDRIQLTVLRDGREGEVVVRLGTRPVEEPSSPMWDSG